MADKLEKQINWELLREKFMSKCPDHITPYLDENEKYLLFKWFKKELNNGY